MKKKYPEGATWHATGKDGEKSWIQLVSVVITEHTRYENWQWRYSQADGSGYHMGWGGSLDACRRAVKSLGHFRFRRAWE